MKSLVVIFADQTGANAATIMSALLLLSGFRTNG
jgi:hypothetical protein